MSAPDGRCEVAAGADYSGLSPRALTCGEPGKFYWSAFFSQVIVCESHAGPMMEQGKIFRSRAARKKAMGQ